MTSTLRRIWAIDEQALAWIDDATAAELSAEQAKLGTRSMAVPGEAETAGKVAILSLQGVITPHGSMLMRLLGLGGGGLEGFRASFREALADEEVGAILLNINSPGGLVDLVPETAREVRTARGSKPIVAVANTTAASAAYYIASQADELMVTPSGDVGSIGVVVRHEDLSGRAAMLGIKPTLIASSPYKTEGNPFEPLSDEARETFQALVDDLHAMFVADVAAGRGVKESVVSEDFGQGRMALAEAAVTAGMADGVATLEETIARLGGPLSAGNGGARAEGGEKPVAEREPAGPEAAGPAAKPIRYRKTATSDASWDGSANEKRLPSPLPVAKAREAYAWLDDAKVEN